MDSKFDIKEDSEISRIEHPIYSKNRVSNAGKKIAKLVANEEDWAVLENWRNSHSYVLNTFRATITRNVGKRQKRGTFIAQRLKRKITIVDKLTTGRASDLSTMNDMAGCRIIFKNLDELHIFRKKFHEARFQHKRINDDKFNYIENPKITGYRGIHDVFSYFVNSNFGKKYNGLHIEVQYRTYVQHAWATAVEISDLINKSRVKFENGVDVKRETFFALASEFLARQHENCKGPLPNINDCDLVTQLRTLEDELHLICGLGKFHKEKVDVPNSINIVLHFGAERLKAIGFKSSSQAIKFRQELELANANDDVVYVRGENSSQIRNAFRNYFRDSKDFVKLMEKAFE